MKKQDIIDAMIRRVCQQKNVNYYVRHAYFVNIYMGISNYYEEFISLAENLFEINGHPKEDALVEIKKYFGINDERHR